jgi:anti-anti-sigma regulatory factor
MQMEKKMKNQAIKVNLFKLIAKNIATRQAIKLIQDEIFNNVKKTTESVDLDFTKVDFISRSFADEILNLRKKLKKQDITLNFVNINDEIIEMLKVVSSHKKRDIKPITLKAKNLDTLVYQF